MKQYIFPFKVGDKFVVDTSENNFGLSGHLYETYEVTKIIEPAEKQDTIKIELKFKCVGNDV